MNYENNLAYLLKQNSFIIQEWSLLKTAAYLSLNNKDWTTDQPRLQLRT
jgi:hypothetical protein